MNIFPILISNVALFGCFLGVSFGFSVRNIGFPRRYKCLLVIDGGSTSTKTIVFQFGIEGQKLTLENRTDSLRKPLKLHKYTSFDYDKGNLTDIFENRTESIKEWTCDDAEVLLGATGGVRKLKDEEQKEIIQLLKTDLQTLFKKKKKTILETWNALFWSAYSWSGSWICPDCS